MKWAGHTFTAGRCKFRLWAPLAKEVCLQIEDDRGITRYPLYKNLYGYWQTSLAINSKTRYFYILDGKHKRADPASFWQPKGVFGPSATVDLANFGWEDRNWGVFPLKDFCIYELHVGTFSRQGTFLALINQLGYLKELGINAIELMPVSQFSGDRNWGYDGVFPFAVQNTYGGPETLQQLVNAAHCRGLAVILDVVYNHLGPEGNYFPQFGPYFTPAYRTAWGKAINFDGPHSREVRNFFIQNALFWLKYFHVDALRLDAVHGIFDFSANHFLSELAQAVRNYCLVHKKTHYLIAESDLNDSTIIRERDERGYGLHAQWNDDYHHSIHACITKEKDGYYADFGKLAHIKKTLEHGYCYDGTYSLYRKRLHGNSARGLKNHKFIAFIQNHDQVGNRMLGERLTSLASFEACKLAAAMVILSPFIPLLFMGEEYGETSPFFYFTSHRDKKLGQAIARGRAKEFSSFRWKGSPPHPQHRKTFHRSKLKGPVSRQDQIMLDYYKALIALRKKMRPKNFKVEVNEEKKILFMQAKTEPLMLAIASFNPKQAEVFVNFPKTFKKAFCSSEQKWGGPGSSIPSSTGEKKAFNLKGYSYNLYTGVW